MTLDIFQFIIDLILRFDLEKIQGFIKTSSFLNLILTMVFYINSVIILIFIPYESASVTRTLTPSQEEES